MPRLLLFKKERKRAHQIWHIYGFLQSKMFQMFENIFERTFSFASATGFAQTSILCTFWVAHNFTWLNSTALHNITLHMFKHRAIPTAMLVSALRWNYANIAEIAMHCTMHCTWLDTGSALYIKDKPLFSNWKVIGFFSSIWRWLSLFSAPFWRTSLGLSLEL